MPEKRARQARHRLVLRCSEPFHLWATEYADYLQVSTADLLAQALLRHAEMTGYATTLKPPQRTPRPKPSTYRIPGPWPAREAF